MIPRWQHRSLSCKHRIDVRRTRESFAGHCWGTRFYSIRFEYVRAERAGNRRLREHEFTLLSGLMARISLCRGLRECKLEERDRDRRVDERRDGAKRYSRGIVNRFGLQNCCPSKFAMPRMVQLEILSPHPLSCRMPGIMLINIAKSTFDIRWFGAARDELDDRIHFTIASICYRMIIRFDDIASDSYRCDSGERAWNYQC